MADLVVGLSKTAVQLLADKVKSAIKEEEEQWKTVQRDLVFITGEFEMMQAFLEAASEQQVRNRIVRTWVRQVRDLSHDVEDNIDFVLHLDPSKPQPPWSWWRRLVLSCAWPWAGFEIPPPPVDEAVAETALLRARVVDVSQRNIRYNLITEKPVPAAMDQLVPVQNKAVRSFDVLINAVRKSGHVDLAGLISSEDMDLKVVSICETEKGDLVQVAIARKAYNDARICTEFACRAWVKLTHPFNPLEFIRSLMTQFLAHSCKEQVNDEGPDALEQMQQSTLGDLLKQLAQEENKHRYLIVLEDLSTLAQLDAIRSYLPDRKKGSRIVVLTHHPVVASQCTGEPCKVSELEQFSKGHSVRVFYKESFRHDRLQSFAKANSYDSLINYGDFGRHTEMDELFEKTKETRLISVWGMPGVGKSALIKAIYQKLRISNEFHRHAWVTVSHPFSPTDFCQNLLVNLHTETTSLEGKINANTLGAEDPIKECRNYLREVCLFVIDGVQSNEDWDWIKSNLIQYGNSRSCIITITSEEKLAKHCAVSSIGAYNVKGLKATNARELFAEVLEDGSYQVEWMRREKTLAVESNQADWYEEDKPSTKVWYDRPHREEEAAAAAVAAAKKAADILLSKCSGHPKMISSVAGYLASKRKGLLEQEMGPDKVERLRYASDYLKREMRNVNENFTREIRHLSDNFIQEVATNPEFDWLRDIQAWIHSYVHACPRHLKKYMLYLSIFPEYSIVRRRRLIRRWIAEGYSKGTDSNSMEKYAEKIFDEIAALSIMQPVLVKAGNKVIGYQVNYFFREYIMSLPVEETLFFPVDVSALEKERHGRLSTEGIGQHLAIGSSWEMDRVALDSMDLSRLRSLTVFNNWFRPFYISDGMKVLRVLDLEDAVIDSDSDFQLIGKLPSRLKFLSLRGQRVISQLPQCVGDLSQLQTLDIRDTSIVTLPPFITGLRKLQSIRAGTSVAWTDDDDISSSYGAGSHNAGVVVPSGIKRLEALQTLGAVRVNTADEEAILGEILSLPQLKKLQVSGISEKRRERSLWSRLECSTHLESLTIHSRDHIFFRYLPKSLQSLMICGPVMDLNWSIEELGNLVKLTIQMSAQFNARELWRVGKIPSLRTLRLRVDKVEDDKLLFPEFGFSELQVLEIACKSKIHVGLQEGATKKLEQLKIHCLEGSEIEVSGLKEPVSLKQIWLLGCSFFDALSKSVRQQLEEHQKIPAPKVNILPRLLPVSSDPSTW